MIPIEVKGAGRLIVALDAGAWIDLVRDAAVVKSITHGHGPACPGIRKMVEYDVTPGRYQLQIVNATTASIHALALVWDAHLIPAITFSTTTEDRNTSVERRGV